MSQKKTIHCRTLQWHHVLVHVKRCRVAVTLLLKEGSVIVVVEFFSFSVLLRDETFLFFSVLFLHIHLYRAHLGAWQGLVVFSVSKRVDSS